MKRMRAHEEVREDDQRTVPKQWTGEKLRNGIERVTPVRRARHARLRKVEGREKHEAEPTREARLDERPKRRPIPARLARRRKRGTIREKGCVTADTV
jgi:hypothetical protein